MDAAEKELLKIGQFADQARQMAAKRLQTRTTQKEAWTTRNRGRRPAPR
jgi:hypothetical protein